MAPIRNLFFPIFIFFFVHAAVYAQLAPGTTAPDFTLLDIDGNSHHLYDKLDSGKTVFLVFSATWCWPCWNYHNSGAFETVWNDHGPNGSGDAFVMFIESDLGTPESCLYGNCSNTQGDWTAGINFPMVNVTGSNGGNVPSDYQIAYYPTIYAICPDKRVYEPGQASSSILETYINSCDMQESSVTTTEEICFQDGNGSIDLEIQGGRPPVSYSWSNGASTQDLNGISAGTFSVTMTDQNDVTYSTDIILGGPDSDLSIQTIYEYLQINCHGELGSVHLDPQGGVPPYSALWSDGSTALIRDDLAAGNYDVSVTDDQGCQVIGSYELTQPQELLLILNTNDETCGQGNGSILAESFGGTGYHSYDIGNGPTDNPLFEDLEKGTYQVIVTDINDCSITESVVLFNIEGPQANAPAELVVSCEGDSMVIDASLSQLTPGTDILWTTNNGQIVSGANSLTPTVISSGDYTLTLSDPETCNDESTTTVSPNPSQPTANAGLQREISCSSPTAILGSDSSSSGNNIEYLWWDESGIELGSTQFIEVNQAGIYTLQVKDTAINCSSYSSVEVTQSGDIILAEAEVRGSINCMNDSVMVRSLVHSGQNRLAIQWTNRWGELLGEDSVIYISSPGMYLLKVRDSIQDCELIIDFVVTSDLSEPEILLHGDSVISCISPRASIGSNFSDLDTQYIFQWRDPKGAVLSLDSVLKVDSPGVYTFWVQNLENGCSSELAYEVTLDKNTPVAKIEEPDQLSCSIKEVLLDGSRSSTGANFIYQWYSSDGYINGSTDNNFVRVTEPGSYTLEVSNTENGCTDVKTVEVIQYDKAAELSRFLIDPLSLLLNVNAEVEGFYEQVIWDFGDGTVSNSLDTAHQYKKRGYYEVCLTLGNDCGVSESCTTVFVNYGVPLEEAEAQALNEWDIRALYSYKRSEMRQSPDQTNKQSSLYPNPTKDVLNLAFARYHGSPLGVQVFDINGRNIFQVRLRKEGVAPISIDVSNWPEGLYVIKITGERTSELLKFIKQ